MILEKWPAGPREWSPRLDRAFRQIEQIRSLIPAALLKERIGHWEARKVIGVRLEKDIFGKTELLVEVPVSKADLKKLVPAPREILEDLGIVWLYSDGVINVEIQIYYLLTGQIPGFEHLAGRWPWKGSIQPPD